VEASGSTNSAEGVLKLLICVPFTDLDDEVFGSIALISVLFTGDAHAGFVGVREITSHQSVAVTVVEFSWVPGLGIGILGALQERISFSFVTIAIHHVAETVEGHVKLILRPVEALNEFNQSIFTGVNLLEEHLSSFDLRVKGGLFGSKMIVLVSFKPLDSLSHIS